jgi:propionyl-CoA carboxylase alpha chain
MIRAIDDYEITGIETTLGFCKYVMEHQAFQSGNFDTKFVEKYFKPEVLQPKVVAEEEQLAAIIAASLLQQTKAASQSIPAGEGASNWKKNRL